MLYVAIWYVCCYEGEGRTAGRIETYQTATYSIRTLLKMDCWRPKRVELLNVMNKINHQILCILLDYRYIAKWYTVHTISSCISYYLAFFWQHWNKCVFVCVWTIFLLCVTKWCTNILKRSAVKQAWTREVRVVNSLGWTFRRNYEICTVH